MYWTRYRTFVLAAVLATSAFALLHGAAPQVPTGTWSAAGALGSVRAGSASALLPDAALLVTGGKGADGALATTEVLGSSGTFSPAASMNVARFDHAAVALDEGRVLVVGGHNPEGAVASAEIYSGGEWSPVGDLTDARWGHTATLLADGRVLIAGGENAAGVLTSVELFNQDTETFSIVGTLSSPRKGHAAARLADGRVLIAGGFSGDAALSSIDVFDPETESVGPLGVSLGTPRAGLSATTLLDGKVLFFGGNDGSNDLAMSEIFNAATGAIAAGPAATAARRDHDAFLLPNNNAVLIVGGATADGASASAELYLPWLNQFWSTAAPAAPRYRATGSALSTESYGEAPAGAGVLVVAGGDGQSGSEAYGFATISVDKDDYSPGETVHVSGRGWQPGDVTFELREVVPEHTPRLFTLTADERGVIPTQELFLVEPHHLGVRFYLTARDAASQAQITFTDGNATIKGVVRSNASGNPPIAGATVDCRTTATNPCNNLISTTTAADGSYTLIVQFPGNSSTVRVNVSAPGFAAAFADVAVSNTTNPTQDFTLTQQCTAPAITSQPVSQTITYGSNAIFTTTATGSPTPVVQWQVNSGSGFTNLAGETSTTLTLAKPGVSSSGNQYRAVFANTCGGTQTATTNGATLTVTPKPVTITPASGQTKVYGTPDPTLTYTANQALESGDTFTGALSRAAGENVGSYAITLGTLSAGPNYALALSTSAVSFVITTRAITFKADDVTRTYGESTPAFTYTITSGDVVNGDDFGSPTFSVPASTVGTHVITLSGLTNPNYAVTLATGTLTVTPRLITFKADDVTRTYGESTPDFSYSITAGSIVNDDAFGTPTFSAPAGAVGTHTITLSGLSNPNYVVAFATGTLTVTPRPITFKADDVTRTYGETTPAFSYSTSSGSIVNGDDFGSPTFSVPASTVGTHVITLSGLTNPNYAVTFATGTLTVTPRPITFKADDVTRTYGETTPAFTYTIASGSVVDGDEFGSPTFSVPSSTVGTHVITLSGLANPNYAVTFVAGTLTVTPRPVTVTADAQAKVYGENDPALTYKVTAGSVVSGDSFSGNLSRVGGENVGAYAIQQGSLALNGNYALTYVAANLTITARPITVTANTQSKTYGGMDPSLTYQTTSGTLVNGDAFSGALTRAPGENAGIYAILQGSLTAGNNYALTFVGALLTINKAPLIVTATATPAVLAYPAVPAIGVTFAGFVNNETSAVLGGALVQTVLVGNTAVATAPLTGALPPGQYTVQPSGLSAQNYAITYCPAAFIITNAAPVIVAVTGPAPIAIGTGGIASATLNVSFTDPGVTGDTFTVGSQWTAANGAAPSSVSTNVISYGGLTGAATITATGLVPGVYTVLVTVTDQFAATSSPYEYHYVVVYDPAGGFVTGGGWIDSPAGACQTGIVNNVCAGSATGKANFGFVAKYLKGQQKPDGNTEFQFQAGNLSFKSTDYEWLVISGTTQAQFKGSGTINGSGNFGFILTAVDGDNFGNKKPDAFRLKIWDTVSGSTVYDNQLGRDESSLTDATVLGGGSIVIHGK